MYVPIEALPGNLCSTCYELTRLANEDGVIDTKTRSLPKLLSIRCNYDIRTADRHLRKLREAGWIVPERQLAPNGQNLPTKYRILGNEKKTAA